MKSSIIFLFNLFKIWTNTSYFVQTNYAILRKNFDIAQNTSACNMWGSAFGALGHRFESCRPDSNNPSHRGVYKPVFFCLNSILNECGQTANKRSLIKRESILSRRYKKHFKNNSSQSNR